MRNIRAIVHPSVTRVDHSKTVQNISKNVFWIGALSDEKSWVDPAIAPTANHCIIAMRITRCQLCANCTSVSDVAYRQRLRSASSHEVSVPRYRLCTYGRRAFAVAGPTVCPLLFARGHAGLGIRRFLRTATDSLWRRFYWRSTNVFSALQVFLTEMRYTNPHLTFDILHQCIIRTKWHIIRHCNVTTAMVTKLHYLFRHTTLLWLQMIGVTKLPLALGYRPINITIDVKNVFTFFIPVTFLTFFLFCQRFYLKKRSQKIPQRTSRSIFETTETN